MLTSKFVQAVRANFALARPWSSQGSIVSGRFVHRQAPHDLSLLKLLKDVRCRKGLAVLVIVLTVSKTKCHAAVFLFNSKLPEQRMLTGLEKRRVLQKTCREIDRGDEDW